MRILQLDLIKIGAFTSAGLDFSAAPRERPGFHLVYGLNEAGKSTARRALRVALYGFGHQTDLDFLHDQTSLRVGLAIENQAGGTQSFIRRKGAKNTFLGIDGKQAISDELLARCLAGIDTPDEFERAFAIGHEELRAGGEAMLNEDNAEGILSMAAAGLPGLKKIEREFLQRSEQLFLPSGKKPVINQELAELKQLREKQRTIGARADEYLALQNTLAETRQRRSDYDEQMIAAGRERERLARLREALPTLARLRQRLSERDALGDVPRLDDGFAERRIKIERELSIVNSEADRLERELAEIREESASLSIPEALIAGAEQIDHLHRQLEVRRKETDDSKGLRGEVTASEREMRERLRKIDRTGDGVDPVEEPLQRSHEARIRKLASDRDKFQQQLKRDCADAVRKRDTLENVEREIEAIGGEQSLDALECVLRGARQESKIDERLANLLGELQDAQAAEEEARRTVQLWSGSREELAALVVPGETTIEEFQQHFDSLTRREERQRERRAEAETNRDNARHQLATIDSERDVPSTDMLRAARALRDRGWREVRRELEGHNSGPDRDSFLAEIGGESLVEGYEAAVRSADMIADRLRREAETVGQIARLKADEVRAESELERIARDERTIGEERVQLNDQWNAQWTFLSELPRSPREMRAWCGELRAVQEQLATSNRLGEEHARLIELRADLRGDLLEALSTSGTAQHSPRDDESLSELLDLAESVLTDGRKANQHRENLIQSLRTASEDVVDIERRIEETSRDLNATNAEWEESMARLSLAAETSNESALAVLAELVEVDNLRWNRADRLGRIEQMDRNREEFAEQVESLVAEVAPDCARDSFENSLEELHQRLDQARTNASRRDDLREREEKTRGQLGKNKQHLDKLRAELRLCCQQAGCADAGELPVIENRAARAARLDREIEEHREDLLARGGGRSLQEFQRELESIDGDAIPARLEQLDSEFARLSEQKDILGPEIGALETELSAFTGKSEAADLANDIAAARAKIARQVEQYARARIAAWLLREARERYCRESGGALLEHASQLFAQLTREAFTSLRIDFDHKDRQTLLGIRAGAGSPVSPTGMSDGTRDQLYLALRLAWLHDWLDRHEPLPFVVDDLLIHFDDDRAGAALDVLADLSQRTQVIFLTHHDHLRDLARQRIPDVCLYEYELQPAFAQNGQAR